MTSTPDIFRVAKLLSDQQGEDASLRIAEGVQTLAKIL